MERPPNWSEQTIEDDGPDGPGRPAERRPYLVVLQGPDRGRRVALETAGTTLGRSDEADVVIHDERISRVHCRVSFSGGRFLLEDLASRNGTHVDGVRTERATLDPEATFRIGGSVLRVELKAPGEIELEDELFRAATTDALTGIPNRRWFGDQAEREFAYHRRHQIPLSAVMVDVDHFKRINDTHGHPAGDAVLKNLAALLMSAKRKEDLVCRYGGEEFLLVLRDTPLAGAGLLCERLRRSVAEKPFEADGLSIPLTISLGVAALAAPDQSLDDLVKRADRALYAAKEGGRNRVEADTPDGAPKGPSSTAY